MSTMGTGPGMEEEGGGGGQLLDVTRPERQATSEPDWLIVSPAEVEARLLSRHAW